MNRKWRGFRGRKDIFGQELDDEVINISRVRIKFVPKRKIRKLHKDNVKSDFRSYVHQHVQGK